MSYSDFTTENSVKDGTELEFTHENVPEEFEKEIEKGWEDYYWKPLKKYLQNY